MAQQNVLLKVSGLYSFPNRLSAVPNGALLIAKNLFINRDSIAESRRGFKIYSNAIGTGTSDTAHQLLDYKGRLIRHWGAGAGTLLEYDSDGAGTFASFQIQLTGTTTDTLTSVTSISSTAQLEVGMYVSGTGIQAGTTIASITSNTAIVLSLAATATGSPTLTFKHKIEEVSTGTRIKGIEQNSNFFFTTAAGIKKISVTSAAGLSSAVIGQAGGFKALDVKADINNNAGFLDLQSVVAYRIVWGIKDSNNNLILGTPSERTIIRNLSATLSKTVDLIISIPRGITTSHFYQVYRTDTFSDPSATLDPGDEQRLVYEDNPVTADLTNGYVAVTDVTPASFRGANLYTNADSGEGIAQANDIPPLSKDITSFKEYTFYANTKTKQRLNLSMLGTAVLKSYQSGTITSNTLANPTVVTSANHGLTTGRTITIAGSNSTPSIDGGQTVTFITANTFSVPVNVTVAGTAGTWITNDHSTFTITDGTTTNTYTFKQTAFTGDTHSNTTIDNITSTSGLTAGLSISGTNIAAGTYVVRIVSGTSIEISQNATATTAGVSLVAATESVANKQIALSQFATPSQQVDETARSLVRIVNRQSGEQVYVFYLSGPEDVPGLLLLEARNLNQTAFYLNVDSATTTGIEFSPNLPISGNSVISSNETKPNRVYYSKFQQPEAVPILNYVDIGPQDKEILRIVALRDNLFVLKEEGIYRLSGLSAPFQVYPFDFSTSIKAADSAVVLNNLIYMFSDQGIATISDTGVSIISRPIEDKLLTLLIPSYTSFTTATFGVSYESDRAYYLFTVEATSDTVATQCFRFNTFTNTWTILDITKRCGLVNSSDDRLYLGAGDTNYIEQERKSFSRSDFSDREYAFTLSSGSVNATTITFPLVTNIGTDDTIVQTQYLTIGQFNRLLSKLDADVLTSPHNYVSTQTAVPGDNLSTKLDALITKISTDTGRTAVGGATAAGTYTALSPTPASFSGQQTTFNSLISLLNNDAGINFSNYMTSTGTVDYEFPVLDTDSFVNTVTTDYTYPLIAGPVTSYAHIETELQFVPQYLSDVSLTKQVSEGTLIFEDASFSEIDLSYASDLSADFVTTTVEGSGNGTFGNTIYGDSIYGGNGSGIPLRTYIPRDKQRCRYLNVKFNHKRARELFSFYGISLSFMPVSSRGYR